MKGGRCEACQGDGVIKIEMHFLPDVYVTCDVCKGRRYNRETLEVLFKGKSIADVLDMTVEEASGFFEAVPTVRDKMISLRDVGLGYIKVGQQATTLSGGEAQRVKLAKELSRRATGRTLYILDEPDHRPALHDVAKLMEMLHELVDQGNTVVVIEHNLEVIKTADWIVDLGPEGGDGGGRIVATGRQVDVVKVPRELHRPLPQGSPGAATAAGDGGGRGVGRRHGGLRGSRFSPGARCAMAPGPCVRPSATGRLSMLLAFPDFDQVRRRRQIRLPAWHFHGRFGRPGLGAGRNASREGLSAPVVSSRASPVVRTDGRWGVPMARRVRPSASA